MQFKDIIGQEEVKRRLRETVRQGRISHALLFTGAEGTGALPLALAYAQYVNCRNRTEEDSCGECPECYRMQRLEHPDCHYIYPVNASKEAVATGRAAEKPRSEQFVHLWRQMIPETGGYLTEQEWYARLGIENQQGIINKSDANELVRQMGFKAFEGGYKTVVVWLPERLHETAANTLLKLVEEPPERTLFLFVSAEPEKIIATIRSRTQTVALAGVADDLIARELVARRGITTEGAEQDEAFEERVAVRMAQEIEIGHRHHAEDAVQMRRQGQGQAAAVVEVRVGAAARVGHAPVLRRVFGEQFGQTPGIGRRRGCGGGVESDFHGKKSS